MRNLSGFVLLSLLLSACGILPFGQGATETPTLAPTAIVPHTPIPAATSQATPTDIALASPTLEATSARMPGLGDAYIATPVPAVTDAVNTQTIIIFMVLPGDNGLMGERIGCADSLVPVEVAIPPYIDPIRAALTALFDADIADYPGLFNGLYLSQLAFGSVSLDGTTATVRLTGRLVSGGICDDPRIIAQIKTTVLLQNPLLTEVSVLVDGRILEEILSLQGK
ncbi:MAG: hypothetical protein FJZ96_04195 [Chloroflexi bacterium]|nr:hypothetical protein [Chloroflexota bacterium]